MGGLSKKKSGVQKLLRVACILIGVCFIITGILMGIHHIKTNNELKQIGIIVLCKSKQNILEAIDCKEFLSVAIDPQQENANELCTLALKNGLEVLSWDTNSNSISKDQQDILSSIQAFAGSRGVYMQNIVMDQQQEVYQGNTPDVLVLDQNRQMSFIKTQYFLDGNDAPACRTALEKINNEKLPVALIYSPGNIFSLKDLVKGSNHIVFTSRLLSAS